VSTPRIKSSGGFVFPDSGEQYRIKLRLSDGRFVYLTDGPKFTILSKEGLISDPRLEQVYSFCAYSDDLTVFGDRKIFQRAQQKFVTPVETIPELVDSPVDDSAFVLGGVPVHHFIGLHNPGLS
jgi:hypothetical protein